MSVVLGTGWLSVAELASVAARRGPQVLEAMISRRLRYLIQTKAVVPTAHRGTGRTAWAVFDELACCRALVILELDRMGLSIDILKELHKYLPSEDLRKALDEVTHSDPYYFHLSMEPEYFGSPGNVLHAGFNDNKSPYAGSRATITLRLRSVLHPLAFED